MEDYSWNLCHAGYYFAFEVLERIGTPHFLICSDEIGSIFSPRWVSKKTLCISLYSIYPSVAKESAQVS
jgi:hypothetical protein